MIYRAYIKRLMDIFMATVGLLVLSIPLLMIALIIRYKMGSPIIFRHRRPGFHGIPFTLYKFRTMTNAVDADGELLPDEDRITPLGQFLRGSSLDELPELFNVLLGQMSVVGPRPLLMEYLEVYSPEQMRRHDVRPGITGWAQIHGRNTLSWPERLSQDVWYVDNLSLWLDIKIILLTVIKVLKREGISQEGYATCEWFSGTETLSDSLQSVEIQEGVTTGD